MPEFTLTTLQNAMNALIQLESFTKNNPAVRLPASDQHYRETADNIMEVIRVIYKK